MDYGTDLYLDENRDVVFTADGDVKTQEGAALVAQDIREALSIPLGSVGWDADAGSNLLLQLNNEQDIEMTVCNELERVALADARVDASTVSASKQDDGRFKLSFRVLGSVTATDLLFDLKDLLEAQNG